MPDIRCAYRFETMDGELENIAMLTQKSTIDTLTVPPVKADKKK